MVITMTATGKLIFGVGIDDAIHDPQKTVNGKRVMCDFYARWTLMLGRCYGNARRKLQPTYYGCYTCDDWHKLSNFKSWMESQDWKGKHLDKDILVKGNKLYSPETCVFVDSMVNSFVTEKRSSRTNSDIGSSWNRQNSKYVGQCRNPFTGRNEFLGYFHNSYDAHLAWKRRKHELALVIAEMQTDERVASALRSRYA